jgi:predicted  nucleic acid-binding Zn-ribbon protein
MDYEQLDKNYTSLQNEIAEVRDKFSTSDDLIRLQHELRTANEERSSLSQELTKATQHISELSQCIPEEGDNDVVEKLTAHQDELKRELEEERTRTIEAECKFRELEAVLARQKPVSL